MTTVYTNFKINDLGFYAVTLDTWNPFGTPAFANNGQPIPYGPGDFSVTLLAVPYDHTYNSSVDAEGQPVGSYLELFNIWRTSMGSVGGVAKNGMVKVKVFDPMANNFRTINTRMPFPQLFPGFEGTAKVQVKLEFTGAFLSDGQASSYTGGYIQPGDGGYIFGSGSGPGGEEPVPPDPPIVPGDPPPPADPTYDYFYGTGLFGAGYYGRGEGVIH